ncbi:MAG: hypothetical protein J6Q29_00685 [Alistipes sp.]|nr:hypothetical protein [Alistipes sp.]
MKSIAKILSNLLHPFLIPIYVEALLLFSGSIYTLYPMRLKVYLIWAVGLYSAVLPLLTMALLKRIQRLRGREIQRRHKMTIMMFVCAVCYLLFAITMMRAPSLIIFRKMASSALLCTMFCIILSRFTRSSSHLTAMGAAVAFFVMLNIAGEQAVFWILQWTLLAAGLSASIRLYLGRNRSLQLLVSFVGGFLLTTLSMLYL